MWLDSWCKAPEAFSCFPSLGGNISHNTAACLGIVLNPFTFPPLLFISTQGNNSPKGPQLLTWVNSTVYLHWKYTCMLHSLCVILNIYIYTHTHTMRLVYCISGGSHAYLLVLLTTLPPVLFILKYSLGFPRNCTCYVYRYIYIYIYTYIDVCSTPTAYYSKDLHAYMYIYIYIEGVHILLHLPYFPCKATFYTLTNFQLLYYSDHDIVRAFGIHQT